MSRLDERLAAHFKEVDLSKAAEEARLIAERMKISKEKEQFKEVADGRIRPIFQIVRDSLLERNCPAAIVTDAPRLVIATDGYIGLFCSDDIAHSAVVSHDPMFYIGFAAQDSKVTFEASRMMLNNQEKRTYKRDFLLRELDSGTVEALVFDAVRACFPILGGR